MIFIIYVLYNKKTNKIWRGQCSDMPLKCSSLAPASFPALKYRFLNFCQEPSKIVPKGINPPSHQTLIILAFHYEGLKDAHKASHRPCQAYLTHVSHLILQGLYFLQLNVAYIYLPFTAYKRLTFPGAPLPELHAPRLCCCAATAQGEGDAPLSKWGAAHRPPSPDPNTLNKHFRHQRALYQFHVSCYIIYINVEHSLSGHDQCPSQRLFVS